MIVLVVSTSTRCQVQVTNTHLQLPDSGGCLVCPQLWTSDQQVLCSKGQKISLTNQRGLNNLPHVVTAAALLCSGDLQVL